MRSRCLDFSLYGETPKSVLVGEGASHLQRVTSETKAESIVVYDWRKHAE